MGGNSFIQKMKVAEKLIHSVKNGTTITGPYPDMAHYTMTRMISVYIASIEHTHCDRSKLDHTQNSCSTIYKTLYVGNCHSSLILQLGASLFPPCL